MRPGAGKVFGRAAAEPLPLILLGSAVIGAIAFAGWPMAVLGGLTYVALVAADVSSPEFRHRVLGGRARRALPEPRKLTDLEVRAAVERIAAARAALDQVVKTIPPRIQRNITAALTAIDELAGHGATLAVRADELSRYLAGTDRTAALRDADALTARANQTADPAARDSYQEAALAARERITALADIATARERALAHLARIESAIKALPPKLVRLRALDDQASDALTGDIGAELERMNIDVRAFEQTLEAIVEVPA